MKKVIPCLALTVFLLAGNVYAAEITHFRIRGQTASVFYECEDDALGIVAAYDIDSGQMLTSQVAVLQAGEANIDLTFSTKLPEEYRLSVFMLDRNTYAPLCPRFDAAHVIDPLKLEGVWKPQRDDPTKSYQVMSIEGLYMEIYWVFIIDGDVDNPVPTLYWAGTYTPPKDVNDPYTWTSVNDLERTQSALFATEAPEKKFTYENGKITYEVSFLGEDMKIQLEKTGD